MFDHYPKPIREPLKCRLLGEELACREEEWEGGAEKEEEKSYLENSFWPFLVNPNRRPRPVTRPLVLRPSPPREYILGSIQQMALGSRRTLLN